MKKLLFWAVAAMLTVVSPLFAAVEKGPYLIYEGMNTEMTLLWQLNKTQSCTVRWGTDASYSVGSGSTSEYGSDHQHKYTITHLQPGTKYYYEVVGVGTGSFVAAPPNDATAVKIFAYGDTRTYPGNHDQVAAGILSTIQSDSAYHSLLLHTGDWVDSDNESDWANEFFPRDQPNLMEMQSKLPINGAIGNHEGSGTVYKKYYPFPYENAFYWTFEYGPVQIFVVDQYRASIAPGSAQYQWLENALATSTKQWKVMMYHHPAWSAGGHSNHTDAQNYLHPLCTQYGVDLVMNGHNHYYARAVVDGTHYVTAGGGGAPLYNPDPNKSNIVSAEKTLNFCEVDINGNQMVVTARRPDGSMIDTFQVTHSGSFNPLPTADAGVDQFLVDVDSSGDETVSLDASGSSDDGSIVSYVWKEGSTQIATGATPTVSLALGAHDLTLEVIDDDGATSTDTVTITIVPQGQQTTVSSRVSSSFDDVEQREGDGFIYTGSSDLELVYDSYNSQNSQTVGMLFQNVNVPQGAVISDAYIQFTCDETSSGTVSLTIQGDDVDNAAGITATDYDVSSRAKTSAQVSWSPASWGTVGRAGTDERTPNLATIIQEITDRSNWQAGNAMAMIVTGSGTGARVAESYDGSAAQAPELVVTYTIATSGNQSPTADAGANQAVTDSDGNGAENVRLDGSASSDSDGTIASYVWSEGGTQIATGVNPTVSLAVGTHTITLTVTDDDGATATDTLVVIVTASAPAGNWTAYNDCSWKSGQLSANITTVGLGQSGALIDYASGAAVGPTLELINVGGVNADGTGGPMPNAGTDAHSTFDGIVSFENVNWYGSTGWYVDAVITGLDPDHLYEFATSVNRGESSYTDRWSKFTISGADAAVQASTPGVQVNSPTSVSFWVGDNTANGYVARWTDIQAGADGTITVRVEADGQNGNNLIKAYAFDGLLLRDLGPATTPTNQAPVADAGADQTVTDADNSGAENVTLDGSGSSDSDGTIASYIWSEGGTQIATGAIPTVSLAVGTHTITLTVTDDDGATATDTITAIVASAEAGLWYGTLTGNINTTNVNPKSSVTIDLSETEDAIADNTTEVYTGAIYDADGQISFTEDMDDRTRLYIDGTLVLTSDLWSDRVSTGNLNLSPGWHTFELRISNGSGGSGPNTEPGFGYDPNGGTSWVHPEDPGDGSLFRLTMPGGNQPPVADAGADQTVTDSDSSGAENVTLDASGSSDSDGTIATYIWSEGGTQIATGANPTISLAVGTHTITLTVTDDDGATATDTLVVIVTASAPAGNWTAYNDCSWKSGQLSANITTVGLGQSGALIDYASGAAVGPTLELINVGGVNADGTGGPMPNAGTDAHSTFDGIVSFANVNWYGSSGWYVDAVITGLDPDRLYEFATSVNRGNSSYTDRWSKFTISGAEASVQASTSGVQVNSPTSVSFWVGDNTANGYVARWTDIQAGADGTITVRVEADAQNGNNLIKAYAFDGLLLRDLGPATTPTNQVPVADAGANQTVTDADNSGAENVTLDGFASSDSDGTIASYVWSEGGTQIATGVNPTVSLAVGTHTVTLTVTDDDGATATDTVTIQVESLPTYSVTYTAQAGGSIQGDLSQTVVQGFDATAVTAVASNGYQFVDWSDGLTAATRTDTNVTGTLSFTANFSMLPYTAWAKTNNLPNGSEDRLADPDQDGWLNLIEFALGMNPMSNDTARIPTHQLIDGSNVLYSCHNEQPTLNYSVQVCGDLSVSNGWLTVGSPIPGTNGATASWTIPLTNEVTFIRLKVEE